MRYYNVTEFGRETYGTKEKYWACRVAVDGPVQREIGPQCWHKKDGDSFMCKFHNTLTKKGKVFFIPGDE